MTSQRPPLLHASAPAEVPPLATPHTRTCADMQAPAGAEAVTARSTREGGGVPQHVLLRAVAAPPVRCRRLPARMQRAALGSAHGARLASRGPQCEPCPVRKSPQHDCQGET